MTIIKLQRGTRSPRKTESFRSNTRSFRPKTESFRSLIAQLVPPLVVIGSSTGGPKTLVQVLSRLPKNLKAAIVIVQHLDQEFSGGLAEWLNIQTPLQVRVAARGARPEQGIVDVAGTNDHLILTAGLTFAYTPEPQRNPYRPSVDVFFKSVAKYWPDKGCAVLLTGMGRDGAAELANLRKLGWHTITQDKTTSVVYGMPKAAKELNAAVEILPVEKISSAMVRALKLEA
jgi:two-component system response regulator WspF